MDGIKIMKPFIGGQFIGHPKRSVSFGISIVLTNVSSVMSLDGSSSRTRTIPSGPSCMNVIAGVSPKSVPMMSGHPRRNFKSRFTCMSAFHDE